MNEVILGWSLFTLLYMWQWVDLLLWWRQQVSLLLDHGIEIHVFDKTWNVSHRHQRSHITEVPVVIQGFLDTTWEWIHVGYLIVHGKLRGCREVHWFILVVLWLWLFLDEAWVKVLTVLVWVNVCSVRTRMDRVLLWLVLCPFLEVYQFVWVRLITTLAGRVNLATRMVACLTLCDIAHNLADLIVLTESFIFHIGGQLVHKVIRHIQDLAVELFIFLLQHTVIHWLCMAIMCWEVSDEFLVSWLFGIEESTLRFLALSGLRLRII